MAQAITNIDSLADIFTWECEMKWLVPDLLAEGSVTMISSASGTGKTWFAYFLAGAVAHGAEVFGKEVKQRRVLYVDGENPAYLVKRRLLDLGISPTPNLTVWGGWLVEPPGGPSHAAIVEFARKHQPLIIWDSLVEFHTGSEQDSSETRKFMKLFRRLANLGATVVILHHTGKAETAQTFRGSSDIEAAVDTAFKLEARGEKTNLQYLTVRPFKTRLGPMPTIKIEYLKGQGFRLAGVVAQPAAAAPDPALAALEVVKRIVAAQPRLAKGKIVESAMEQGVSRQRALDALENGEVFIVEDGPNNSRLYSLIEEQESTGEIVEAESVRVD